MTATDRDLRFRGDLWNTTASQREAIIGAMFDDVRTVHSLGSGLYVNVTFHDGTTTTVGYDRMRKFVWDQWRKGNE